MKTKQTKQTVLLVACLVLAAAITLIVVQGTSAYTRYSDAFNNMPSTIKFIDMDASVSVTADGKTTRADAGFLMDSDGGRFSYVGSLGGDPFTQFTDGSYMYIDYKGVKTQYQGGTVSPLEDTAVFTVDNYIRNYAAFIDYQSFMSLGLLGKMNRSATSASDAQIKSMSRGQTADGIEYSAVLTDSARDALFNAVTAVQSDWEQQPEARLNSLDYVMRTGTDNVVNRITLNLSFDVTFDAGETKTVEMQISMGINSINKAVTVTVPSTEGFTPNFSTPSPEPEPEPENAAEEPAEATGEE